MNSSSSSSSASSASSTSAAYAAAAAADPNYYRAAAAVMAVAANSNCLTQPPMSSQTAQTNGQHIQYQSPLPSYLHQSPYVGPNSQQSQYTQYTNAPYPGPNPQTYNLGANLGHLFE